MRHLETEAKTNTCQATTVPVWCGEKTSESEVSLTCVEEKPPSELRCETSHLAIGTAPLKSLFSTYVNRAYAVISMSTDRARTYGGRHILRSGSAESSLLVLCQYFRPSTRTAQINTSYKVPHFSARPSTNWDGRAVQSYNKCPKNFGNRPHGRLVTPRSGKWID